MSVAGVSRLCYVRRILADKTGLMGLGAKNGTHRIESSKTVRVGFGLRKTGSTGFRPKNVSLRVSSVRAAVMR